jgi:hypothetical protein
MRLRPREEKAAALAERLAQNDNFVPFSIFLLTSTVQ